MSSYAERIHDLTAQRDRHALAAESQLADAALHVPPEDIAKYYAEATAHATLAIFYQSQIDSTPRP